MSNTKGSIRGAGTVYRSGEPGITQRFFSGGRIAQYVSTMCIALSTIVCPCFHFLLAIVLFVLF